MNKWKQCPTSGMINRSVTELYGGKSYRGDANVCPVCSKSFRLESTPVEDNHFIHRWPLHPRKGKLKVLVVFSHLMTSVMFRPLVKRLEKTMDIHLSTPRLPLTGHSFELAIDCAKELNGNFWINEVGPRWITEKPNMLYCDLSELESTLLKVNEQL